MTISFSSLRHRTVLLAILALSIVAGFFALSRPTPSRAAERAPAGGRESLPNYDIRTDKTAFEKLAGFRAASNRNASQTADLRDTMVRGEKSLRQRVPTLKVEYNHDLQTPEIIAPDAVQGRAYLSARSGAKRSEILKEFLNRNAELVGARGSQIADLKVFADYTNPDGNLSFVELNQEVNGIPVFRGEVKAGFTKGGELIRVVNNLAPALEPGSLSTDFGDPLDAVNAAAGFINVDRARINLTVNRPASDDLTAVFGTGDSATTAEKMYFPTEPGVAVPAWRVLIWQPESAHYVIVDAGTGTMLWRKNITEDQSHPATYSVYTNPNAMINVAHSPFPLSPGPSAPNGMQGTGIARTSVTRIGNEAPYTFNQLGWIADGGTRTDGNAVQAGIDRDGTDGVDSNSEAVSAGRDFTFAYNPLDPNTNMGEAPVPASQTYPGTAFQQGSVTQLFYICNLYHDEMYRLGFTEAARNFQNVNFTGEGLGGDRVRAEGQDSADVNNANFSTPADGTRPRMQMYVWTGSTPDIDGNLDASLVIHEHTHGLSNRLHGNGAGLTHDMSRGMGEGWSDFYGLAMLSQPADPIDGIYVTSAYTLYRAGGTFVNNNYYGIRRFPIAIRSSVGANGRPHNPLTFADVDATQISLSDGAFSPRFTGTADQVHNIGEVWCSALWEIRARMITRLGWAEGNRRILQFVTDGMKLAPLSPTLVSERDAIIAAGLASGTAEDIADMWAGFAARGLGAAASVQNPGGTSTGGTGTARVTESFAAPNLTQTPQLGVSDFLGNNNGALEPGETLTLNIPLTNATGMTATGVTLEVVGGASVNYGTVSHGQTVTRTVGFLIPASTPCGSLLNLTFNVNSSLGPATFTRSIAIGAPAVSFSENFDSVTPPAVPDGWTVTSSYAPMTFVSTATSADTAPNSMFAADLPNCTGASCPPTNGGSTELTSPAVTVNGAAGTVSFRHKYNTEDGFDGGVLEIRRGGALQPWEDILAAGGAFLQHGYNGTLGVSAPNPLGGRAAWTGDSGGYVTTVARLPQPAFGFQTITLRWRFGTDNNTAPAGGGWNVDSIQVAGNFTCSSPTPFLRSRADFDGDGRTDLSVFRPADGSWYLDRSTQGFTGVSFGLADDIPTPGDFDGDRKTDIAVWRPSNGTWYRINSTNGTFVVEQFGLAGDIPQGGDFDGDLKDDKAVFRPSNGTWYWENSGNGQSGGTQFGQAGDMPAGGDYDGDGRDDLTVFRPSAGSWYRLSSRDGGQVSTQFGVGTDLPVNADYDGDNREDISVFRPSDGTWYRLNSGNGQFVAVNFGLNGDVPVPGDYDGDGRDDIAVYRAGTWYLNRSTSGLIQFNFGIASDVPIPKKYVP